MRATHHFLTEQEIQKIKSYVPQAICQVEKLVVAYGEQVPVGFMGVDCQRLEMLFLAPSVLGAGDRQAAFALWHTAPGCAGTDC